MSRIDSRTDPSVGPDELLTEKVMIPSPPGPTARSTPRAPVGPDGSMPLDSTGEPDEWPARGPAKSLRLGWPVAALLALLLAGGGIWGGAALQRSQGSSSSSLASTFASRLASARGGTSPFGGVGGSSSGATTGTVTEIKGSTLYVTNSSGNLVEITVSSSTTVTRDAKSTLSDLKPGDTVVVQGTKAKNGTVTASSVSATADGVSAGFAASFPGSG
jgi:hypothetical protein